MENIDSKAHVLSTCSSLITILDVPVCDEVQNLPGVMGVHVEGFMRILATLVPEKVHF